MDYAIAGYPTGKNRELGNVLMARVYPKIYKAELVRTTPFKENVRMFESHFLALADSIFWLPELKRTCRLPFFQDALKADLSNYVDVSDSDYLFLRMMASPCKLYAYFVWRCIRRKLGVIKRYIH